MASDPTSSSGKPIQVVVRPEILSSEAELLDVLPHYTGHLAPSLRHIVTQQILDEIQKRGVTKGELPSLVSALILRLFRPEDASEDFKRDSGSNRSSVLSLQASSSSGYCLAHSLSSSPRSLQRVSPQHLSQHRSAELHDPAAVAAAVAGSQSHQSAIPAQVSPPFRDSPRSSLRRARVTAMQEALMNRGSNERRQHQQQQQQQQHQQQGPPVAPSVPKMNPAESLRRSRSFVEAMKTAASTNSGTSSGVSNSLQGTRSHDRSSGNFTCSTTGNSAPPLARPHSPVHARLRSPYELPFKVPTHRPAQPQSPFVLARPRAEAINMAEPSTCPPNLPPIRTPLASAQPASATPTALSASSESLESSAPPATPSPPMTQAPSPPPLPSSTAGAQPPPPPCSTKPTQTAAPPPPPTPLPQLPSAATSGVAAQALSSGLVSAASSSLDPGYLDAQKGLGLRNSPHGSELCSPFRLAASTFDGSNRKKEEGKQRIGRRGVGFAPQASDGSGTSGDSPGASPSPSSGPLSPRSIPLGHSCHRASALKGRSSADHGGTGDGDSKPLRRCVSFAVPQNNADDDDDQDDSDGEGAGHAKPCRPLASRHRSEPLGRSSRRSHHRSHSHRHQHEDRGEDLEGHRGSRRHRRARRASNTGFDQDQSLLQTEAERCSRVRDASNRSRSRSIPRDGSDNAKSGSLDLSKRRTSSGGKKGRIWGGTQGDVQPQQMLPTKTDHHTNTASTAAAAGNFNPTKQQPVSTATASGHEGGREVEGEVTCGTGEESERGESNDSSNSEEDVSKAVAKLLRKRYPALALPLLQVLESRCRPQDLLLLAAAPVKTQQQSLDTTVQRALKSLMGENSLLRSRVRELETLACSSSASSNSSSAPGLNMLPATNNRLWAKARSLGHNPPGPAGPHSLPAILTPDSAPGASPPSGKLVPLRKRHSELPSEVWVGPSSAGSSGAATSSVGSREHSSEAFSELTLRPLQLKRSARNSVYTASTRSFNSRSSSLSRSQSLYSNRSLYNRWSSSVRSSVRSSMRSRSSVRSRATTSDSKQEDEEHHGPDLERMGHDEIAAVAAASLRARGSVPSEGLDQSPSRTDECWIEDSRSPKGVPKHPAARRGDGVEGAEVREHHRLSQGGTGGGWVPRSEMTPYGLQALHERLSSASGSNCNDNGTAGSTRSSRQQHSDIQEAGSAAAATDVRGAQEIEEETAHEGQSLQLSHLLQQHQPQQQGACKEQQTVRDRGQVAKQPPHSAQGIDRLPQCCAVQ